MELVWQGLEYLNLLGSMLVEDDIMDYGSFDRLHHWMIGELIRLGALLGGLFISVKEITGR